MKEILILVMLLVPSVAISEWSVERKVAAFHEEIVKEIQDGHFSGPIARELAQYSQLRVCLEDGPTRSPTASYCGLSCGSPNKEILRMIDLTGHKLTTGTMEDGICYGILGEKAHILSSVAVARWYDSMILSDRFRICNEAEKKIWNESKWCSHQLAIGNPEVLFQIRYDELRDKRLKILKKANAAYGPASSSIEQQRKKIFKE